MMLYAYQQKSIRKKDEMSDSAHPEITRALSLRHLNPQM